ncbi:hypothetical protein [Mucilaginibacter flavus]|uniref:hypothetical protein n=1 Tax=Mucilaginibacter flavus TaxID=931504 RepID=UPI0025B5C6F7|nr:hypothetical protein [Mucilaginibacter flavus]MDN3580924.1 hypothetical protein [Mucilaginibacter flavus]
MKQKHFKINSSTLFIYSPKKSAKPSAEAVTTAGDPTTSIVLTTIRTSLFNSGE